VVANELNIAQSDLDVIEANKVLTIVVEGNIVSALNKRMGWQP